MVTISQSAAQRLFPRDALYHHVMGSDPVLKSIPLSPAPRRVVGIVPDVDDANIVPKPTMTIHHPFDQESLMGGGRLFVHLSSNPYSLVTPITHIMRSLSADQPVEHAATLDDVRADVL